MRSRLAARGISGRGVFFVVVKFHDAVLPKSHRAGLQAEPGPGEHLDQRPTVPVRSFELTATARELRSTLQMVEFRLESAVDAPTRREVRLVIGELVARWLQCAGAIEPMILTVTVLEDRVRLDISASRANLRPEVWSELCRAPGLGLSSNAEPSPRSDSGVFVELPLGR